MIQWMNIMDFKELLNTGPKNLSPYVPGKNAKDYIDKIKVSGDKICKLSSNENPLGPSPSVKRAISDALENIYFYPDPDATLLKSAISEKYQVSHNEVVVGNGSDEIITQLIRLFANQNRGVLTTKNSFPAYKIAATACDVAFSEVNDVNFNSNVDALLEKAIERPTALIFIANPNNPSGAWLEHNVIYNFLHQVPKDTLVVLDEAYAEYAYDISNFVDSLSLFRKFPNLIILRTFSKAYGLAGLRVGYGLCHHDIAKAINTIRLPFNVNHLAQVAATAALSDLNHLKIVQKTNSEARMLFFNTLKALGLKPIESASNSLMFDARDNAHHLEQKLIEHGIIPRMLSPFGLPSYLRINTGTVFQNDYFIKTLCQICEP